MTPARAIRPFLPAAGHDWLLPFYDPLSKLLGVDAVRHALLDQAGLRPGDRVLDLGCGTGSLAVLIKRLHPSAEVVAIDPDPNALARARRKAARAGVQIRFDQGYADALGYPDGVFDRIFSSMMLHHLGDDERERSLRESRRVLRPGGRLELLDLLDPTTHGNSRAGWLFHANHRLKGNVEPIILALLAEAGFVEAKKLGERGMALGRAGFFQATAPPAGRSATGKDRGVVQAGQVAV
jgi:ubiquinone/menaquinone biosynthesis C-methylase UbiE